ncbi:MAG: hypothetical protein WAT66_06635 [Actinomycetota bacterium]
MKNRLLVAHVAFIAAMVLHTLDHFRQGTDRLSVGVLAGGTFLSLIAVAPLWLTVRRHPKAPQVAMWVGYYTAVAVTAAHVLPNWGVFSDPYPSLHLDAYSWAVMLAEIGMGVVFGTVGLLEMRRGSVSTAVA